MCGIPQWDPTLKMRDQWFQRAPAALYTITLGQKHRGSCPTSHTTELITFYMVALFIYILSVMGVSYLVACFGYLIAQRAFVLVYTFHLCVEHKCRCEGRLSTEFSLMMSDHVLNSCIFLLAYFQQHFLNSIYLLNNKTH